MKILVAEDDPISVHVLKKTLEYWRHEVIAVSDGKKALEAIKEHGKPEIIFSDWDMPELNGPGLCEKLRSDPENDDVYIIMLTAKDRLDDMMEGFISGVDDYISKPVTENDLRESLTRGIHYLEGKEGFTNREELIKENIMRFENRHV